MTSPVSPLAPWPLVLAYVLYPLSMALPRLHGAWTGRETVLPPRNWIDAAWLTLGLAGLVAAWTGRGAAPAARPSPAHPPGPLGWLGLAGLALVLRFGPALFAPAADLDWAPLLMELKPFFYLGVTAALLAGAAPPSSPAFVRCGLALALLLLADLALTSLQAGALTRPFGSGEVNYDACLLVISLVFALRAERIRPAEVALLILGLGASLSRTGLAAGMVAALLARTRPVWRLALAVLLAAGVAWSVAARGVSVESAEDLDRFQMWAAVLELFQERPQALLTGFPPGRPLPVEPPNELAGLFAAQAEEWAAAGTHAFNFHGFWPRAAVTWGLFPPLLLALALPLRAWRTRRAALLALLAAAWVLGLSMGLIYLGNVGPPLLLALRRAAGPPAP